MVCYKKSRSTDHMTTVSWYLAVVNFILGTALFFHGFLLTRSELADISRPLVDMSYEAEYKRLILLLVDGLSFDFLNMNGNGSLVRPKMSFTSGLGRSPSAFMAHFWADPPTTTLQRLKALATGSMPTFIDAGTNFGGTEVVEDNLILQWKLAGRRMLFVGDDTWMGLFPKHFQEAHPYSSFNVKDLDTVDEAVSEALLSALDYANTSQPWDIFIGHMLGIDHCGHTFGPSHPEMKRKVSEVDQLIKRVVVRLSADDLLVVLGDHGMTDSGDHGGDSPEELDAGLFVYSKRLVRSVDTPEKVNQIDLVPTLAHWTGVPVPFSNLGVIITALFEPGSRLRNSLVVNFIQMFNYTLRYWHSIGRFPLSPELDDILARLSVSPPLDVVRNLTNEAISSHLHALQQSFRGHWTRFDVISLWFGIGLSVNAVVCLLFVGTKGTGCKTRRTLCLLQLCQCLAGTLSLAVWSAGDVAWPKLGLLSTGLCCAVANTILLLWQVTVHPPATTYFLILSGLTYFSNSFLVHELRVTIFLLQTLILYAYHSVCSLASAKFSALLPLAFPLVLLRLVPLLEVCREESSPSISSCFPPTNPWLGRSLTKLAGDELVSVVVPRLSLNLLLFWAAVLTVLKSTGRRNSLLNAMVLVAAACTSICWLLDATQLVALDQSYQLAVSPLLIHRLRSWIARLNLALLAASLGILLLLPGHHHPPGSGVTTRGPAVTDLLRSPVSHDRSAWLCSSVRLLLLSWMTLLVFAGDGGVLGLGGTVLLLSLLWPIPKRDVFTGPGQSPSPSSLLWLAALLACLADTSAFYATGHQPTFSSLPWDAAFTAFVGDHTTHVLPTVMVLAHLYSGPILVVSGLPLLAHRLSASHSDRVAGSDEGVCRGAEGRLLGCGLLSDTCSGLMWRLFVCKALLTCLCSLAAGLLRRHLMVWKIFAPRLLFSVVGLIVSSLMLILIRLTVFCWTLGCDCQSKQRRERVLSSTDSPAMPRRTNPTVTHRGYKSLLEA